MARKIQNAPDAEELHRAKELRDKATTIAEYRMALVIILIAEHGFDATQAANALGKSRRTILRDRIGIRNPDGAAKKTKGGRKNFSMTLEEECEFLSQWLETAITGGVTVATIHAVLEKKLGRTTPLSTTYRLLARHGWRKANIDHPRLDPRWLPDEEFKTEVSQ